MCLAAGTSVHLSAGLYADQEETKQWKTMCMPDPVLAHFRVLQEVYLNYDEIILFRYFYEVI